MWIESKGQASVSGGVRAVHEAHHPGGPKRPNIDFFWTTRPSSLKTNSFSLYFRMVNCPIQCSPNFMDFRCSRMVDWAPCPPIAPFFSPLHRSSANLKEKRTSLAVPNRHPIYVITLVGRRFFVTSTGFLQCFSEAKYTALTRRCSAATLGR